MELQGPQANGVDGGCKAEKVEGFEITLDILGGSVGSGERRVVCDKGVKCTRTVLSVELGPSSLPWRLTRDSRAVELTVKEESGFIGKGVGSVEGGEFDDWGMEELKMMGEKKRKMSSFVSHYL